MAKPIIADSYQIRANDREGLLFLDFHISGGRSYQFVLSPRAVDQFCSSLKEAAAAAPAAHAVVHTTKGFQSRMRLLGAEEARAQVADLSRNNSFVVGADASKQSVWMLYGMGDNQVLELKIPLEDARKMHEGIGRSLTALSVPQNKTTH